MPVANSLAQISSWDRPAARHILSRTIFGHTRADIDFAVSLTMHDFIDNYLLADTAAPADPGDWVIQPPKNTSNAEDKANFTALTYWWYDLMRNQGYSLREKMVLFWHNHFTSDYLTVKSPQLLYRQNRLFRANAFGNLIDLTKAVTIDSAMLIYLDGASNKSGQPNENYARELMELFTMGIGNYTEEDISEAARALTGWWVHGRIAKFNPDKFDGRAKTFLGETGKFNHEDIVDIIFKQEVTATWFCTKLFKAFVYNEPDMVFINQLAAILRTNGYNFKPVLSALFKSQYFHSQDIRGAKIKSPIEFLLTAVNQLSMSAVKYSSVRSYAKSLQQELFQPPDVRGWVGHRNWISTTTYPTRNQATDLLMTRTTFSEAKFDVVAYAKTFPGSENPSQFVSEVAEVMLNFELSESRKEMLVQALLDGSAVYDWSTSDPQADSRLRGFFKALMRLPEYQLS